MTSTGHTNIHVRGQRRPTQRRPARIQSHFWPFGSVRLLLASQNFVFAAAAALDGRVSDLEASVSECYLSRVTLTASTSLWIT